MSMDERTMRMKRRQGLRREVRIAGIRILRSASDPLGFPDDVVVVVIVGDGSFLVLLSAIQHSRYYCLVLY